MKVIDFSRVNSVNAIAQSFSIPEEYIKSVIKKPEEYYEELHIPKKGRKNLGKYRTVYKASEKLANMHAQIQTHIDKNIYTKENIPKDSYISQYAYGFVRGRGTLKNAKVHLNKKYLLNIDIKKFFKNIKVSDVYHAFLKLGAPEKGAILLSKICTYNSRLEEGLHTSPTLSNLICYELDMELVKIANMYKCSFTRYADDMTFSGNRKTPNVKSIEEILNKYKFSLNINKTRKSKFGQAQYVTGLSISNDVCPRVPKKIKKRLRMKVHYIKKFGFCSHLERNDILSEGGMYKEKAHIEGWLRYILGIEPKFASKLIHDLSFCNEYTALHNCGRHEEAYE